MPVSSLKLKNFQAHSSFQVDLDPNLTTIIGPSDVGKSAILRALRWLALNAPQGDSFVKNGEKVAEVVVEIDGKKVVRQRGRNGENLYALDGQEFRAFGTTVPEPISDFLTLEEVNFVGQHQPLFWFSESAGEVSRQINQIVDLGIIDTALYNIGKEVRKRSDDLKVSQQALEQTREKKEGLKWILECETDFKRPVALRGVFEKIKEEERGLTECLGNALDSVRLRDKANATRQDAAIVGRLGSKCQDLLRKTDELQNLVRSIKEKKAVIGRGSPDISALDDLVSDFKHVAGVVAKLSSSISSAKQQKEVADKGCPDFELVQISFEKVQQKREDVVNLEWFVDTLVDNLADLRKAQKEAVVAKEEFERETGDVCPICGSELKA